MTIVGYFMHRHFLQFDRFKKDMHKRFNLISNEISDLKYATYEKFSAALGVDKDARSKINNLVDDIRLVESKILKFRREIREEIESEKLITKELTDIIRTYKVLKTKKGN